jgi:hypothetical protein
VSSQSFGEAFGPIVGSFLTYNYSFMVSTKIFCLGIFVFIFLYIAICGHVYMFMNFENQQLSENKKNVTEEEIQRLV